MMSMMTRRTVLPLLLALAALLFLVWPDGAQGQSELSLSDFDQDGLEVEALALFVAGDEGDEPALYNVSSRWGRLRRNAGGEIGIGPDDVPVQRVMSPVRRRYAAVQQYQRPSAEGLLRRERRGNDLTIWVQTAGGNVSFPASGRPVGRWQLRQLRRAIERRLPCIAGISVRRPLHTGLDAAGAGARTYFDHGPVVHAITDT